MIPRIYTSLIFGGGTLSDGGIVAMLGLRTQVQAKEAKFNRVMADNCWKFAMVIKERSAP